MIDTSENPTIVPPGEKKVRRARCKFCGKEFSRVQLEIKMPVISHFMGACPDALTEIERMASSLIEIVDDEKPDAESIT